MTETRTRTKTKPETKARSVLVAAVVAIGLALVQCGGDQQGPEVPLVSAPTEASGAVVQVDAGNFDAVVLKGEKPCLVEFYATWCSYCQRMEPTVARIATRYVGRVVVGKIDVDTQPGLVGRWGVRAWPTFVLFRKGTEVGRHVGMATEAELAASARRCVDGILRQPQHPERARRSPATSTEVDRPLWSLAALPRRRRLRPRGAP